MTRPGRCSAGPTRRWDRTGPCMIFGTVRRTRCRDPGMPLTDVQWVMGHVHLATTQQYLNPLTEDVIAGVLAFHSGREPGPGSQQPAPAGTGAALLGRFPPRPVAAPWPAPRPAPQQVLGRALAPPFALAPPL